jgi:hypothetical protein
MNGPKNLMTTTAPQPSDGFDWTPNIAIAPTADEDNPRPQRSLSGDIMLKFDDPEWTGNGLTMNSRELVLIEIHHEILKWPTDAEVLAGAKGPAEVIPVVRGQPEPDLDALNNAIPESQWRMRFGKKEKPYRLQRVLEFLDHRSMERLSWPSYVEVIGSSIAADEVKRRISVVRRLRGEDLVPVVRLEHVHMPNSYKPDRQRPHLAVMGWCRLGSGGIEMVDVTKPTTIEAKPTPRIKQANVPLGEEMDDSIPHN